MRIGILGTGTVGKTLGTKLAKLGHDVRMGSRAAGGEKAKAWVKETGSKSSEGTFAAAAAHGEIVFNRTSGMASLEALKAAGAKNLRALTAARLVQLAAHLSFSCSSHNLRIQIFL